jgi:hypothetical protein
MVLCTRNIQHHSVLEPDHGQLNPVQVVTACLSNTSLAYLHPMMFIDLFETLDAFLMSSLAASSEHFIVLLTVTKVQL